MNPYFTAVTPEYRAWGRFYCGFYFENTKFKHTYFSKNAERRVFGICLKIRKYTVKSYPAVLEIGGKRGLAALLYR